jgi:hypothetical protein
MVIMITFFAFLYVYQQTEILRLAYIGQKRTGIFEDLLDKNSILRYNLEKSVSLTSIGEKISERAQLQMPEAYRLVELSPGEQGYLKTSSRGPKKENAFSRHFGIKTQAEAKTVKP